MLIPIPYNTDAPIYHAPIVTIGMIVVNVVVFALQCAYPEQAEPFKLQLGEGLHPIQWLSNNFMHVGVFHLLGNMIFLWTFGMVVEGLIGSWKYLAIYLAICLIDGVCVQTAMLSHEPVKCLGASSVIFGLMALCLIWTPESILFCVILVIRFVHFFEVRIKVFVGLYIAYQILILFLRGGAISSELLHMVGAIIGAVFGLVLLKTGWVDCDNFDIFSVLSGRHKLTPEELERLENEKPEVQKQKAEEAKKQWNVLLDTIRGAIRTRHAIPGYLVYGKMTREFPNKPLPEPEMIHLMQLLIDGKHKDESLDMIRQYLSLYTDKVALVRLKLAEILLNDNRPKAANRVLAQLDNVNLDDKQYRFYTKLKDKIALVGGTETYELDEGDF